MQIRMEALLFDLVVLVGKPVLSFVMTCIILAKRHAIARDSGRPKRVHTAVQQDWPLAHCPLFRAAGSHSHGWSIRLIA